MRLHWKMISRKRERVMANNSKKKYQVIESDNDANSHKDGDEDGSLSVFKSERAVKTTISDAGEKIAQVTEEMDDEAKDDSVCVSESKQKVDPLDINGKLEREKRQSLDEEKTEVNKEENELLKEMETLEKIIVSNLDVIHGNNTKDTSINQNLLASDGPSLDEEKSEVNKENNELPKEVETLEKIIVSNQDLIHGNNTKDISINQNLPVSDGKNQLQSLDLAKPNEPPKEVETLEKVIISYQDVVQGNNTKDTSINQNLPVSDGKDQLQSFNLGKLKKKRKVRSVKKGKTREISENCLVTSPELGSVNGQKSKKRRKELQLEASLTEGIDEKCQNIPKEDISEQGLLHADSMTKDLPAANGEYEDQQRLEETSVEGLGAKCHNIPRKDEVMQEQHADSMTEELPANGENQEQQIDDNISINSELLATDNQFDKKMKKKKMKITKGERDLNMVAIKMTDNQETTPMKYEDQSTKTAPLQTRTLSNGLIIEELASVPTDGKVAAPGKQVKIFYTAMLKESGHVYDSSVGKAAFEFRLGDEEFIDGWNVGIDGMRVGDKRRLIIPPSMGFGEDGVENVPPNSWVIYDIELVGVRK